MRRPLVKILWSALLAILLGCASWANEPLLHDCRIRSITFTATERGDRLILRAVYRGYDGLPMSWQRCPDQNGPTWGADQALVPIGISGYVMALEGRTGEVRTISIATIQTPFKEFYRERRIRF